MAERRGRILPSALAAATLVSSASCFAATPPEWRGPAFASSSPAGLPDDGLERCSSCFVPTSWLPLPLLAKRDYNADTTIYTFGLPARQSLDLPVCACLLLKAPACGRREGGGPDAFDGSDAVRPYTPISDNARLGSFQLLVKRYPNGAVSQYLHALPVGTPVEFKHIPFNIKAQYPFEGKATITMLCGGTGIAPIYQALGKLLNTPGDDRPVTLLFSNRATTDILLKEELDAYARALRPRRLRLVYVVGETADAPPPEGWESTAAYTAESGWIDEDMVRKYAFPPSDDTLVFVCGVPGFYEAACGPRSTPELAEGTILHRLGYTADMVAKM